MTANFANANGLRIHYRLEGKADAPVVMLCHGLLGTLGMWDAQRDSLGTRFRTLRFDNRGHGLTAVTAPPYSVEQLGADAIALLDALGIARVHFVGCSLGGMIGQWLGANHANRLRSLVLVGSRSVMPPREFWDERIRIARADGIAPLVPVMMARWFTDSFRAANPAVVSAVAADVAATPVEGFVGACMAIREMDHVALLPRIGVPTLVTSGDCDPGVPVADTRFIHASIPEAEMVLVEGARHLVSIERADVFESLLLDWLGRH